MSLGCWLVKVFLHGSRLKMDPNTALKQTPLHEQYYIKDCTDTEYFYPVVMQRPVVKLSATVIAHNILLLTQLSPMKNKFSVSYNGF